MMSIHRLAAILFLVESADGLKDAPTLKCEEHGGTIRTRYVEDGTPRRICVFEHDTACDEECFYMGECLKGAIPEYTSFCRENEGQLVTRRIEWGTVGNVPWMDPEVKWCVFGDGTACSEKAFHDHHRYCHKIGAEWRAILHGESIPFELFCEVTGGEVVFEDFPWGTEDGLPPTEQDDVCLFDDEPEDILAKMHPNHAEALREGYLPSGRPPKETKEAEETLTEIREYAYYGSACFIEVPDDETPVDEATRKEILASINAHLSETCNAFGGESQAMEDEDGDEYILCIIGDKFCYALDLFDDPEQCEEGVGRPPFPVFCASIGGKLTGNQKLCTYDHLFSSEWVSLENLECTEQGYYRYGCDVPGRFPFDEDPTPSMPCADEYFVEIRHDEDGSYAICVRTGPFEEYTTAWGRGFDKRVCLYWSFSREGVHCGQDYPMFAEYCKFGDDWGALTWLGGGKLSSRTFDSGELPVCEFPEYEKEGPYWSAVEGSDGIVCTERFYYDNGGCLPFDVHGADPPAGATVAFRHSLFLAAAGLLSCLLLN